MTLPEMNAWGGEYAREGGTGELRQRTTRRAANVESQHA